MFLISDGTLYLTSESVYVWSPRGDIKINGKPASAFILQNIALPIFAMMNTLTKPAFKTFTLLIGKSYRDHPKLKYFPQSIKQKNIKCLTTGC